MSLLSRIKPLFGKHTEPAVAPRQSTWEMTESAYAMIPFDLAKKHEKPFDTYDALRDDIPPEMVSFWIGSLLQYLYFCFHVTTASTWGNEFAERILRHQVERLNELDPGWGDNHKNGIRKIYDLVKRASENPMFAKGKNGENLEVPLDYRVAVDFLVTVDGSPFRYDPEHPEHRPEIPNDLDWKLCFDLEATRNKAMDYFQPIGAVVRFV